MQDWLIVIPARLHSTRLPEKALQDLGGVPMIVKVCKNLSPLEGLGAKLMVATDSKKIQQVCQLHGFHSVLTSEHHKSGTDRIWEASQGSDRRYILNVQGDEPFVSLDDLMTLASTFTKSDADMGTLGFQSTDSTHFLSPNVVKIVVGNDMQALYFSRSPIPFLAQQARADGLSATVQFWHHQGVYAFRRQALDRFCRLPRGRLEAQESLEQLRALENSMKILVVAASHATSGIDTQEDLEVARAKIQ